ncbi:hypothetical protein BDQ17DRAFT_999068 [Cyathus striatus]|nr:hypothetical protein BDQ17DRAFT_999068 [Cyathus striatus]
MKLTDHLISLPTTPVYNSAINHPFLCSAGAGTLPPARLALWLSQDRIYAAHAYPKFIGKLISQIPFEHTHGILSQEEQDNQRIFKVLVYCLQNIVREVGFFKDTADRWGLDMEGWKERKGTRDYTAEMARVSEKGIKDGLVFLWAMERVYLDAWTFVQSQLKLNSAPPDSALSSFASNWSSPEFVEFVDDLAKLVDNLKIAPGSESWKRAEAIWARVIELEERFWPVEGEEMKMRDV